MESNRCASDLDEVLLDEPDSSHENRILEARRGINTDDGRIILAMLLMRSHIESHRIEAVSILRSLISRPFYERYSDAAYCLALTLYSLNQYDEARVYCEELMRERPDNTQTRNLHEAITFKQSRKKHSDDMEQVGWITIGLGLAASVAAIAFALSSAKRSRRR